MKISGNHYIHVLTECQTVTINTSITFIQACREKWIHFLSCSSGARASDFYYTYKGLGLDL